MSNVRVWDNAVYSTKLISKQVLRFVNCTPKFYFIVRRSTRKRQGTTGVQYCITERLNAVMGKKKSSKKSSKKTKKITSIETIGTRTKNHDQSSQFNFVLEAGPGCYICRRDNTPDWLIEWEDVDLDDFDLPQEDGDGNAEATATEDIVPDVAIDTDERTLSVCNISATTTKVAYVTVYDAMCFGKDGKTELKQGSTTDNNGRTYSCITFIVLCPPKTFCHLVYLETPTTDDDMDITELRIESDVSPWSVHPRPDDEHPYRIGFPLGCTPTNRRTITRTGSDDGSDDNDGDDNDTGTSGSYNNKDDDEEEAFLCTQGEGGRLTHFFSGNQHAIDFRCPVGTELLAVADAVVVEACDKNTLTGIAVTNLFQWNSILLEVDTTSSSKHGIDSTTTADAPSNSSDSPLFVEYVHISKALVKKGDVVKRGQVIGYSGSVGFSPEPHLHFSAFRSMDPHAPTVRVKFESTKITDDIIPPFVPIAGEVYNAKGIVKT